MNFEKGGYFIPPKPLNKCYRVIYPLFFFNKNTGQNFSVTQEIFTEKIFGPDNPFF